MNFHKTRAVLALLLAALLAVSTACSSGNTSKGNNGGPQGNDASRNAQDDRDESPDASDEGGKDDGKQEDGGESFAQAHDAFQTKLAREENDSDPIPAPPEGLFDLVSYPSKVGDLAAYVSSDPGDGEKHPMIIWVVGGWGNGIDDFPFCYPAWDNDQTGSAFWQAGVLTMYPSFRGGCGNPGCYEALFGEVDDIVSAYEYAASLPYVDPERIYLGGHSTGGTRALLASEYTDQFRAVFCFGAVDDIRYHNNSQFTFDTEDEMEYTMRSPIHWLDDVKSPTFLIEGSDGNAESLRNMEKTSTNDAIHCYLLEGADHFAPLAPITPLLAQKILADTGAECNITVTQEELEAAMAGEPSVPLPAMTRYTIEGLGLSFDHPYIWEVTDYTEEGGALDLGIYSRYDDDNPWDMAALYVTTYPVSQVGDLALLADALEENGFETADVQVDGQTALKGYGVTELSEGSYFDNHFLYVQCGDVFVEFDYYLHTDFGDTEGTLFQAIIDSITLQ